MAPFTMEHNTCKHLSGAQNLKNISTHMESVSKVQKSKNITVQLRYKKRDLFVV